jgi:hypothetical protein
MKVRKVEELIRQVVRTEVEDEIARAKSDGLYSVLTVTFGPGSDPSSISFPYKPWASRTDLHIEDLVLVRSVHVTDAEREHAQRQSFIPPEPNR